MLQFFQIQLSWPYRSSRMQSAIMRSYKEGAKTMVIICVWLPWRWWCFLFEDAHRRKVINVKGQYWLKDRYMGNARHIDIHNKFYYHIPVLAGTQKMAWYRKAYLTKWKWLILFFFRWIYSFVDCSWLNHIKCIHPGDIM